MNQPVLRVDHLSVAYPAKDTHTSQAVYDVSFSLAAGDSLGIVGESGSGKTSLALTVMGLLPPGTQVSGQIHYQAVNLLQLPESERNCYRWKKIAIAFQNSADVLNPVLTVEEQIAECIRQHLAVAEHALPSRVAGLLGLVGLMPDLAAWYPHQLSGGMRQRVLLAMALSCEPEILIVDEPTTALDAVIKNEIVELLLTLQRKKQFAMLVISHEMQIIAKLTTKMLVLYAGRLVETGVTRDIIRDPLHPYTRGLIGAASVVNPYRDLWGIPGESSVTSKTGCPFYNRCSQRLSTCQQETPRLIPAAAARQVACLRGGIVTLLQARSLSKQYHWQGKRVLACDQCSLTIRAGEIAVLIGESGSGKSSLAGMLAGLLQPDQGEVLFDGAKIHTNSVTAKRHGLQLVFQDPISATNEYLTIEQAVGEPLTLLCHGTKAERQALTIQSLKDVQLPADADFLARKCHMLSGGQRQRVALARALVMEPKLLVADEISAMLDPSTQANILRLLKGLQNSKGFAMLYITHDLTLAQKIADTVYVMYRGRIIEQGLTAEVFSNPHNSYTQKLVRAEVFSTHSLHNPL